MSLFSIGENALSSVRDQLAVSIDYSRGTTVLASDISAVVGKTLFRTTDMSGISIAIESRDFLMLTEDFSDGFQPKNGDEITYAGKVYMVSAPNGEPCWKWHTRESNKEMRVHTKYIGDDE